MVVWLPIIMMMFIAPIRCPVVTTRPLVTTMGLPLPDGDLLLDCVLIPTLILSTPSPNNHRLMRVFMDHFNRVDYLNHPTIITKFQTDCFRNTCAFG